GKKTLANYLAGDPHSSEGHAGTAKPVESLLGCVLVRDMSTQRVIAWIPAHPGCQVTHLAWDPSGTLLATVSAEGQYVHVYQVVIVPQPTPDATAAGAAAEGEQQHPHSHAQPSVRRSSVSLSPALQSA